MLAGYSRSSLADIVIAEELGIKLANVTLDDLGRAKRSSPTKTPRRLSAAPGRRKPFGTPSNEIRGQIETTTSDYDREKLEERLAKLTGGVAVIRVGAPSEAELKKRGKRSTMRSVPPRRPWPRASCQVAVWLCCGVPFWLPRKSRSVKVTSGTGAEPSQRCARGSDTSDCRELRCRWWGCSCPYAGGERKLWF